MGRVNRWFLAVGAALWMASAAEAKGVAGYGTEVQLRCYESPKTSRALLEQMEGTKAEESERGRESVAVVAAWNLEHNAAVENESLLTSQEAVCVLAWGDKGQILKGRLLSGSYGYRNDTEGCVISEMTAWELFGSLDVVGKRVSCKEKRWVIRGVISGFTPLIVVSSDRLGVDAYQNLSFLYREDNGIKKRTQELALSYGLTGDVMIDGSFYAFAANAAATAPILLLPVLIGKWGKRRFCTGSKGGVQKALLPVLMAMTFLLFLAEVRVPESLIPSRWSDFEFWTNLWAQIRETMLDISQLPKSPWDVDAVSAFQKCVLSSFLSTICLAAAGLSQPPSGVSGQVI